MTIDEFWDIVDRVHLASGGDMDAKCQLLQEELEKLSAKEIYSFQNHFDDCECKAYSYELWGAASVITGGYCSDDAFYDFRADLISMGRVIFEQAIATPELPIMESRYFYEGYQYIANRVYEALTKEMIDNDSDWQSPYDEDWNIDGLPELFPRLFEKFEYRWLQD